MDKRAEELGVKIKTFQKHIDIFDWNGNFICSILRRKDYFFYLKKYGQSYAQYKSNQYWFKYRKEINKMGSVTYYTAFLLY
jgi:hypothetical protein